MSLGLQREKLESFLQSLLRPFESAALLSAQKELLALRYETLADLGTLPHAGHVALKYLQVGPGDVVLLNDPFSGGTLLSHLTLVYGMEGPCKGLTLVVRTGFRACLHLGDKIDEEGLRVPPTPIMQKGAWLEPLLQALVAHPQAPQNIETRIRGLVEQMRNLSQRCLSPTQDWSPYLQEVRQEMLELLAEIPTAQTRAEQKISTGETLRLQITTSPDQVLFDFSGTSPSKKIGLTDRAAMGACAGALLAFFRYEIPITDSTLGFFQVSAPQGSWLHAKYPTPTFRGMTEGVHLIAHLVWQGLHQMSSSLNQIASPSSPTWLSLTFSDGAHFFDMIPSGVGASAKSAGTTAMSLWVRSSLINSVEQIEAQFPIRILKAAVRKKSGGIGEKNGGDGMVKIYEVLKDAELQWIQSGTTAKAAKGTGLGLPSEIEFNSEVIHRENGKIFLPAGSTFEIRTAGGSGYGKTRPPAS